MLDRHMQRQLPYLKQLHQLVVSPGRAGVFQEMLHLTSLELRPCDLGSWRPYFPRLRWLSICCPTWSDPDSIWDLSALRLEHLSVYGSEHRYGAWPCADPQFINVQARHMRVSSSGRDPLPNVPGPDLSCICTWQIESCELLVTSISPSVTKLVAALQAICDSISLVEGARVDEGRVHRAKLCNNISGF